MTDQTKSYDGEGASIGDQAAAQPDTELSDQDLDTVAGGRFSLGDGASGGSGAGRKKRGTKAGKIPDDGVNYSVDNAPWTA